MRKIIKMVQNEREESARRQNKVNEINLFIIEKGDVNSSPTSIIISKAHQRLIWRFRYQLSPFFLCYSTDNCNLNSPLFSKYFE